MNPQTHPSPPTLELQGEITEEDHQHGERVILPSPFLFQKWPLYCALLVLVLLEFAVDGLLPLTMGIVVVPAILMATLWAFGARMIRQRVMYPLRKPTYRIGEDLLEIEDEQISRRLCWSAFQEAGHDAQILILFESDHLYVPIPRRLLPDEVNWTEFLDFINSRLKAPPQELPHQDAAREGRILLQGPFQRDEFERLYPAVGTWIVPTLLWIVGVLLMLVWWGIYGFWTDWQTRLLLLIPTLLLPTVVALLLWWRVRCYRRNLRQYFTETPFSGWLSFDECCYRDPERESTWKWASITQAYQTEDSSIGLVQEGKLLRMLSTSLFRPGEWSNVVSLVKSKVSLQAAEPSRN